MITHTHTHLLLSVEVGMVRRITEQQRWCFGGQKSSNVSLKTYQVYIYCSRRKHIYTEA